MVLEDGSDRDRQLGDVASFGVGEDALGPGQEEHPGLVAGDGLLVDAADGAGDVGQLPAVGVVAEQRPHRVGLEDEQPVRVRDHRGDLLAAFGQVDVVVGRPGVWVVGMRPADAVRRVGARLRGAGDEHVPGVLGDQVGVGGVRAGPRVGVVVLPVGPTGRGEDGRASCRSRSNPIAGATNRSTRCRPTRRSRRREAGRTMRHAASEREVGVVQTACTAGPCPPSPCWRRARAGRRWP